MIVRSPSGDGRQGYPEAAVATLARVDHRPVLAEHIHRSFRGVHRKVAFGRQVSGLVFRHLFDSVLVTCCTRTWWARTYVVRNFGIMPLPRARTGRIWVVSYFCGNAVIGVGVVSGCDSPHTSNGVVLRACLVCFFRPLKHEISKCGGIGHWLTK